MTLGPLVLSTEVGFALMDRSIIFTIKILLFSWIFFLGLFYFGPISYPFNPQLFVILSYFFVGFFLGIFLFKLLPVKRGVSRYIKNNCPTIVVENNFLLNVTGWLTLLYVVVMLLDFIVLGNVLEVGVTNSRAELSLAGRRGSILGMLNILLSGMPVVLAGTLIIARVLEVGRAKYRFLTLLSIAGIATFFLSGGRNFFVISMVILFFTFRLKKKKIRSSSSKIKLTNKIIIALLAMAGSFFVLYLFVERAELRGDLIIDSVINLKSDFGVELNHRIFENDRFNDIYLAFVSLFFYANHSLSLFSEYLVSSNYSGVGNGALTFPLFHMLIDRLIGTNFYSEGVSHLILQGVYLSMLAPLYIDFGEIGVFLGGAFLGFCTIYFTRKTILNKNGSSQGDLYHVAAATFLAATLLAPMYNILSGSGFSVLLALIILKIFLILRNLLRGLSSAK